MKVRKILEYTVGQRAFFYLLAIELAVVSAACARYPALQESTGSVSDAGANVSRDGNSHHDDATIWDHELDGDGDGVTKSGLLSWAVRAGGPGILDFGRSISALEDGSSLVTGNFWGTATFGPGEENEMALTSAGQDDVFLARYNPDGTLAWAAQANGQGLGVGSGVSALADGSAVVVGRITPSVTFGPGEPNETLLDLRGLFVSRYNPEGTLAWAVGVENEFYPLPDAQVATISDGSSILAGFFQGTLTFEPGGDDETSLITVGFDDIYIARFSPYGTLVWAHRAGGTSQDKVSDVVAFNDGSCLTTGRFSNTATFGPGETNETRLTSEGDYDLFLARYNAHGELTWVKRAGGADADIGSGLAALPDGSSLVTGGFTENAVFGPGEPNETTLHSASGWTSFVARYDPEGKLSWARSLGESSPGSMYGTSISSNSISALSNGSFMVTGSFSDRMVFGPGEEKETTMLSAGRQDVYVASYNADGTLAWARRMGGENADLGASIAATSDGSCLVTGRFDGTADFGLDEESETVLTSAGGADVFVMQIGP